MENNIEEDITKINTYIELVLEKDYCNCNELNAILGKHCDGSKNVAYAMRHILSAYRRVLKENEELKIIKSAIQTLQINSMEDEKYIVISKSSFLDGSYKHLLDEYIPVQKIKDKIEELKNNIDYLKQFKDWYEKDYTNEDIINNILEVLQELLGGKEQNE